MPHVGSTGYAPTIHPMASQHGVSPSPSMPYTRHQHRPAGGPINSFVPYNPPFERPSTPYVSTPYVSTSYGYTVNPYAIPAAPTNQYTDAATAVNQNLRSPLDPYADYYQQEMRQPHAGNDFHTPQRGGGRYGRGDHTPQSGPRDQQHGDRRRSRGGRLNQRSSENDAVGPPVGSFGNPYGHEHIVSNEERVRQAYDQLQQLHQESMTVSNRNLTAMDRIALRNEQQVVSNRTTALHLEHLRIEASNPIPAMHDLRLDAPEPPPRHSSRHEPTQRRQPGSLRPARDQPSTALALEHARAPTSRLSPSVRASSLAPTRPRVPPHQQDQENSDRVEVQAMQREGAAVAARYGEEAAANDVMDETPPRIGNVERRLHE
jgi:hypothetical protein